MPSSVVASKIVAQRPAIGRAVYDTLINKIPWENVTGGMTPGFLQRVMFLPDPASSSGLLLDDTGSPVLSKVGQYIWENARQPMDAVEMAGDFTGQHVKKLEQEYFAREGITPPPQSIPTSRIAEVIEKEEPPYGSLQNPRDMREHNPHGTPRPEPVNELDNASDAPGSPQLGEGIDIISSQPSDPNTGLSITNPFIYGPLALATGYGGFSLSRRGEEERAGVPPGNQYRGRNPA